MDEKRFTRLEDKTHSIKEDLVELKSDVKHMNNIMESHVAGDQKIISQLQPLFDSMPEFCELVKDHVYKKQYRKVAKEKRADRLMKLRSVSLWVGIPATVLGSIAGALKIFGVF